MTSLKIATAVMFVAGVISAFNGKEESLAFLSIGFALLYHYQSNVDWRPSLSWKTIVKDLTESRWRVTAVGKLSEYLALILMALYFILHYS